MSRHYWSLANAHRDLVKMGGKRVISLKKTNEDRRATMSDDNLEPVEEELETAEEPWVPSPSLYRPLLGGALATLLAAGLAVASSALEFKQANAQGFTLAHTLAFAALVPGILVVRTFYLLARESESFNLQKGCLGLFGTLVLIEVYDLASQHILLPGPQIGLWMVIGLGLLALIGAVFVPAPGSQVKKAAGDEAPATSGKPASGLVGSLAVVLFVLVKLLGKGILGKLLLIRGLGKLLRNMNAGWEPIVSIGLLLCGGMYLTLFAVSKIRLRSKLGGMAALAGWTELVLLAVVGGVWIAQLMDMMSAMNQPGINDKDLEDLAKSWSETVFLTEVGTILLWSLVTAFLFLSVRARFNPDWAWEQETGD
jgi:hypothetical protein